MPRRRSCSQQPPPASPVKGSLRASSTKCSRCNTNGEMKNCFGLGHLFIFFSPNKAAISHSCQEHTLRPATRTKGFLSLKAAARGDKNNLNIETCIVSIYCKSNEQILELWNTFGLFRCSLLHKWMVLARGEICTAYKRYRSHVQDVCGEIGVKMCKGKTHLEKNFKMWFDKCLKLNTCA